MANSRSKVWPLAAALLALATAALAFAYFRFLPMSTDGGWYAYPAYAWASGGDPSENLPGAGLPVASEQRVSATFGWENRSNLTVLMQGLWLKAFGADFDGVRAYGAACYAALILLAGLAVWIGTGNRLLTIAAALLTAAHSGAIGAAFGDSRPDLPIAVAAMALLAAILRWLKTPSTPSLLAVALLTLALPLMHSTAAISIAFAFLFFGQLILHRRALNLAPGVASASAIFAVLLGVVFVLQQPLMGLLLPTDVSPALEAAYRHDPVHKMKEIIDMGVAVKLMMEARRWLASFFLGNLGQLLFIAAGVASAVIYRRNASADTETARLARYLLLALLGAAVTMSVVDPHPTLSHTTPLIALGIVAAALALRGASDAGQERVVIAVVTLAMFATACLKLGHVAQLRGKFGGEGVSNQSYQRLLDSALPALGELTILGPTEIWPYLAERKQRIHIIDDDRSKMLTRAPFELPGQAYLVVNQDTAAYGWLDAAHAWEAEGRLTAVGSVGRCGQSPACLAIYQVRGSTLPPPGR